MRYERTKELTAIISVTSVVIAVTAVAPITFFIKGWFPEWIAFSIAAMMAALSSIWSIMISRRITKARERRKVFLIYALEDLERAKKLANELRERGFHPWLDVEQISAGQIWQKSVFRALEESVAAIVLVSKHLEKKGFVQEELQTAIQTLQEREKDLSPVIPVRVDDTKVPANLAHVQWVDLFEDTDLDRLTIGLKRVVA